MILKSISVKGSSANLVRYILKEKGKQTAYANYVSQVLLNGHKTHGIYVAGIRLSELDIKHMIAERFDAATLKQFKEFNGTVQEFIEKLIAGNEREAKGPRQTKPREEATVILRHNVKSKSADAIIAEFKANEERRMHKSSNAISAIHTILSFSNKEVGITDKALKDIAKEYVRLRGSSNLYYVVKHAGEKTHVHLHIAMSSTSLNGRSSRISKADFAKIKQELDRYVLQHHPNIKHSFPAHGKNKIEKRIDERLSSKNFVHREITTKLQEAISTQDFISKLQAAGLTAYYRGDRLQGVKTESEIKYRFSRLGVDTSRLRELDENLIREERIVDELRQLRERGHREMQPRGSSQSESRLDRFEDELAQNLDNDIPPLESETPAPAQESDMKEDIAASDQKEQVAKDAGDTEDDQIQDHAENQELSLDDL